MLIEIKVFVFLELVVEGIVVIWYKQLGEVCLCDELIVDIEIDKVVLEVVVFVDGVIEEVLKGEGDIVESGEVIGKFKEGVVGEFKLVEVKKEEVLKEEVLKEEVVVFGDVILSLVVCKLVEENDVDLNFVKGIGKDGWVIKEDVQNYINNKLVGGVVM